VLDVLWSLRARRLTNPEKQKMRRERREREELEKKKREREESDGAADRSITEKKKKSKKKRDKKFPLNREKIRTHSTQYLLSSNIYKKSKEWARV
jgi:hypothetical protein